MELMEKYGFNEMTIQDIHKKAGISVGTFYHYYNTKEDVFFELYRKADEFFEKEVIPHLEQDTRTFTEKVILFFKYYAQFNETHGIEFSKHLYSPKNTMFIKENRFMVTLLRDLIEAGQNSGEFTGTWSAREIANYLFIFSRGLIFDWCIHDGTYDLSETIIPDMKMLMTIFMN